MNTNNTRYAEIVTSYSAQAERLFAFDADQVERFAHSLSCDLGRANIASTGLKFGKPNKDGLLNITSKEKTMDKVHETYAFTLAASIDALCDAEARGGLCVTGVKLPRHLQFVVKQETPASVQTGQTTQPAETLKA